MTMVMLIVVIVKLKMRMMLPLISKTAKVIHTCVVMVDKLQIMCASTAARLVLLTAFAIRCKRANAHLELWHRFRLCGTGNNTDTCLYANQEAWLKQVAKLQNHCWKSLAPPFTVTIILAGAIVRNFRI